MKLADFEILSQVKEASIAGAITKGFGSTALKAGKKIAKNPMKSLGGAFVGGEVIASGVEGAKRLPRIKSVKTNLY